MKVIWQQFLLVEGFTTNHNDEFSTLVNNEIAIRQHNNSIYNFFLEIITGPNQTSKSQNMNSFFLQWRNFFVAIYLLSKLKVSYSYNLILIFAVCVRKSVQFAKLETRQLQRLMYGDMSSFYWHIL